MPNKHQTDGQLDLRMTLPFYLQIYNNNNIKSVQDHARDIEEKNEELKYFMDQGLDRQSQEYEEIIKKMQEDKQTMEIDYQQEREKVSI